MSPRTPLPALLALCLVVACGGAPEDPAEQISEIRSRYSADLNGIAVHQVPVADPEGTAAEGEGVEVPEAGAGEEGEEGVAAADGEVPVRQDVILDILVSRQSREALPGITVDIEHVGPKPERAVKETYRAYLDTSGVHRGVAAQLVHRLEDVEYVEGDGFHVEVRHPVPPEERHQYREFQEAAEGSP